MTTLALTTRNALLIVRHAAQWSVEQHLVGKAPECIAVDPDDRTRLYCGTLGNGLWRGEDAGRSWDSVGEGISHTEITAVAVDSANGTPLVYAGTEPSAMFKSEDAGKSWSELSGLQSLPSAKSWSFPPRPETHHVRWIETDPNVADKVFVAIEAGAIVRTLDGGRTWHDRVEGGPIDTHTAATHRMAQDRIYSAAGDGYFESTDGGESWTRPIDGLRHRYMVGVAVDPGDPETVVVSAASSPWVAYTPRNAESFVYRKMMRGPFEPAMEGLPDSEGTTASRFATRPDEPGVVYAANNRGLYRSINAGRAWKELKVPWTKSALALGVTALVAFPE